MQPSKTTCRKALRQARLALPASARQTRSKAICDRLRQAVEWSAVRTIHCYEPIAQLGEVDVTDFIVALQAVYPKLQLFTSRQINNEWQIISVKTGIPVAAPPPVAPHRFDIIIVPMLGFDPASLHRIGYGGGYYDRLLAEQPGARKIGVCFELGKLAELPAEAHDVPLDVIITDLKVHKKAEHTRVDDRSTRSGSTL